jgi:hypothetical protein
MGQKEGFFEKKPSAATVRLAMEKQMAKVGQLRRWKVSFMPKVPFLFTITLRLLGACIGCHADRGWPAPSKKLGHPDISIHTCAERGRQRERGPMD